MRYPSASRSIHLGRFASALLLGAVLAFCTVQEAQAHQVAGGRPVELTMFVWAGANQGVVPTEVVNRYMAAHPNVKIHIYESNNTVTYPRMVARKSVAPNDPLIHFGFFNVSAVNKGDVDDMWLPLDPNRIPNMRDIHPSLWRPGNRGIGYVMSPVGLLYNAERVKQPPTSWADLWSPRFEGRVTMFDYDWMPLVIAARLNGGSETNIDQGFRVWSQHAKNLKALVTSNDQLKNLLVSGEAWIAPWFASISQFWIQEGAPLGYVTPKEGAIAFPVYLQIVKGSSPDQIEVAEEVINWLLEPQNVQRYAELTYAIPGNVKAGTPAGLNPAWFGPEVLDRAISLDWAIMAENDAAWRRRWDREVKARM